MATVANQKSINRRVEPCRELRCPCIKQGKPTWTVMSRTPIPVLDLPWTDKISDSPDRHGLVSWPRTLPFLPKHLDHWTGPARLAEKSYSSCTAWTVEEVLPKVSYTSWTRVRPVIGRWKCVSCRGDCDHWSSPARLGSSKVS